MVVPSKSGWKTSISILNKFVVHFLPFSSLPLTFSFHFPPGPPDFCLALSRQLLSENSKLWFEWSVNITDYNAEQAIQSDQVLGRFVSSACLNASTFDLSDASENERRMVRLITTSNDIPPIREDNERMLLSRVWSPSPLLQLFHLPPISSC